jgi:hypothetical protein
MQFIPPIGTTGLWALSAPFKNLLLPSTPYTCIAIRNIADILNAGGDPETDFYLTNSLNHTRYQADYVAGVSILTLKGGANSTIYVPSSFVLNFPDIGGIPYTVLALAINIGAIPDTTDLTYLKSRLTDIVKETIGVDSVVNTVAISAKSLLTNADAILMENARIAKIGTVVTDYTNFVNVSNQLNTARQKIAELETFIVGLRSKGII